MALLWVLMAAVMWQVPVFSALNKVFVRDNEIWLQTESGKRQLTYDGVPKRLPTLSSSGDTVMYVVDHPVPQNAPEETIDLLDLHSNTKQRIIPQGYVPAEFDRLEWIDEHRIGAMSCGHANCMYWVLSPASGKTIEVMSGGFDFVWSHNRRFVARTSMAYSCNDDVPEGQLCPEHDRLLFNADDVFAYPPKSEKGDSNDRETHSLGLGIRVPLVWSPDDKWVAFTDYVGPEDDWYVVLVSPGGQVVRDIRCQSAGWPRQPRMG